MFLKHCEHNGSFESPFKQITGNNWTEFSTFTKIKHIN